MFSQTKLKELSKILRTVPQEHGTKDALIQLSIAMLTPANQRSEFRFLHMINEVLSAPKQNAPSNNLDLETVLQQFDTLVGKIFSTQETDFLFIPFISWLEWNGGTYRMFSGTFDQPEIYFSDQLLKGTSLDHLLEDKYGFSFSNFVHLVLPRVHRYIEETGLAKYETSDIASITTSLSNEPDVSDFSKIWQDCFVIPKSCLSEPEIKILSRLSRKPSEYKADYVKLFAGHADIMSYPVINYEKTFILVCPQLLIPAFVRCTTNALARNHKLQTNLNMHLKDRLVSCLKVRFRDEPALVLSSPITDGQKLADVAVQYDRKILLFSILDERDGSLEKRAFEQRASSDILQASKRRIINGGFEIAADSPIEFLHFFIKDAYGDDFIGVPELPFPPNAIQEVLPMKELEYILKESNDGLHFIKFFRARNRVLQIAQNFF